MTCSRFVCLHVPVVSLCPTRVTMPPPSSYTAIGINRKGQRTKCPTSNSEPRPCPKSHPQRTQRTCYPYFSPRSQPNNFILAYVKLRNREIRVKLMSTRSLQLLTVSVSAWLFLVQLRRTTRSCTVYDATK